MKRRLFNVVTALSLLMLLATASLWLYLPRVHRWRHLTDSARYELSSYNYQTARLKVEGGTGLPDGAFRAPPGKHWDGKWANPNRYLALGVWYGCSPRQDPTTAPYFSVISPFALLAGPFAILPLLWISLLYGRQRRARRVARDGLCPVCGYDMRATPERYPECGTVRRSLRLLWTLGACICRVAEKLLPRRHPPEVKYLEP